MLRARADWHGYDEEEEGRGGGEGRGEGEVADKTPCSRFELTFHLLMIVHVFMLVLG